MKELEKIIEKINSLEKKEIVKGNFWGAFYTNNNTMIYILSEMNRYEEEIDGFQNLDINLLLILASKVKVDIVLYSIYRTLYAMKNKNSDYRKKIIEHGLKAVFKKEIPNDYRVEAVLEILLKYSVRNEYITKEIIKKIIERGEEREDLLWIYEKFENSKNITKEEKNVIYNKIIKLCFEILENKNYEKDYGIIKIIKFIIPKNKSNVNEIKRIISMLPDYFFLWNTDFLRKKIFLDEIIKILKNENILTKQDLKEEIDNLKKCVLEIGKKIELPTLREEINISENDMNKWKEITLKDTFEKSMDELLNLLFDFINFFKKLDSQNLTERFDVTLLGKKGVTLGKIITKEEKEKRKVMDKIPIISVIIIELMKGIFKHHKITIKELDKILIDSIVVDESDKAILKIGINNFLEKNYVLFLLISVPRIENILRNILENRNISILGKSKNEGFDFKTLGELLNEDFYKNTFSDDMIFFIKIILNDNFGLNLRNKISHGFIEEEDLNEQTASLVFVVLLFLLSSKL